MTCTDAIEAGIGKAAVRNPKRRRLALNAAKYPIFTNQVASLTCKSKESYLNYKDM